MASRPRFLQEIETNQNNFPSAIKITSSHVTATSRNICATPLQWTRTRVEELVLAACMWLAKSLTANIDQMCVANCIIVFY